MDDGESKLKSKPKMEKVREIKGNPALQAAGIQKSIQ